MANGRRQDPSGIEFLFGSRGQLDPNKGEVTPGRAGFLSALGDFMTSSGLALQGDVEAAERFKKGRSQERSSAEQKFQESLARRQQIQEDSLQRIAFEDYINKSDLSDKQKQAARVLGPEAGAALVAKQQFDKASPVDAFFISQLPPDQRAQFAQQQLGVPPLSPEAQFEMTLGKKGQPEIRETAKAEGTRKGEIKAAEEETVTEKKVSKALKGTERFIKGFSDSFAELEEKFPNIGQSGPEGLIERTGASLLEKTGQLPKTTAFLNRVDVLANQQARDVEGGRVTDKDREVYSDAMANAVKFPSETNVILVAEALRDMQDKGGNIDGIINEFAASNVDILNQIASQFGAKSIEDVGNVLETPSGISFTFEEVK